MVRKLKVHVPLVRQNGSIRPHPPGRRRATAGPTTGHFAGERIHNLAAFFLFPGQRIPDMQLGWTLGRQTCRRTLTTCIPPWLWPTIMGRRPSRS